MNIRKLLAITLLATTAISQTFQVPNRQGSGQVPGHNQSTGLPGAMLHQMHIEDDEQLNVENTSPVTANVSPVGVPPVSPIFAILQNSHIPNENEGHVVFAHLQQAQGGQGANQFPQFNAAAFALFNAHQNQVGVPLVPHNSPREQEDVITSIALDGVDNFYI